MSEFISLTLGTYTIQIDKSTFDLKQRGDLVEAIAKDNPELKAIIFIENIPKGLNRDEVYRDTFSRDPFGAMHKMHLEEASITGINLNLFVKGHLGFDVFSNTSKMSFYRISYWLDGADAISIFSTSPVNDPEDKIGLKDKIVELAISIKASIA